MPQRKKPERKPKHLDFIRQLPCLVCGDNTSTEAAHIRSGTDGGMGLKPSDSWTVPLCGKCHRTGDQSQERLGERRFWCKATSIPNSDYALIFARAKALLLWQASGDYDEGLRIVERANG